MYPLSSNHWIPLSGLKCDRCRLQQRIRQKTTASRSSERTTRVHSVCMCVCVCVNADIINGSSSCRRRISTGRSSIAQRRGTGNMMCPSSQHSWLPLMASDIVIYPRTNAIFQLELVCVWNSLLRVVRDEVLVWLRPRFYSSSLLLMKTIGTALIVNRKPTQNNYYR